MSNHYVQSLLGEREKVLRVTHQHWFTLVRSILFEMVFILAILAAVIIIHAALFPNPWIWLGLLLLTIPFGGLVQDYLVWLNREFILTNRRVMQISGVFNKNVTDSSLEKVNDVKMSQSFFGRMFDFGDIEILTASELGVNKFQRISNPVQFKITMLNAKEDLDLDNDHYTPRRTQGKQVTDLLTELNDLHLNGVLTSTEYETKKAELLLKQ